MYIRKLGVDEVELAIASALVFWVESEDLYEDRVT